MKKNKSELKLVTKKKTRAPFDVNKLRLLTQSAYDELMELGIELRKISYALRGHRFYPLFDRFVDQFYSILLGKGGLDDILFKKLAQPRPIDDFREALEVVDGKYDLDLAVRAVALSVQEIIRLYEEFLTMLIYNDSPYQKIFKRVFSYFATAHQTGLLVLRQIRKEVDVKRVFTVFE